MQIIKHQGDIFQTFGLFFIGLFIVRSFIYLDYGISCDGQAFSRLNGEVNYNFIKTGDSKEFGNEKIMEVQKLN